MMKKSKRHDNYGLQNKVMNAFGDSRFVKPVLAGPVGTVLGKSILGPMAKKDYDIDRFLKSEDGRWLMKNFAYMIASDDGPKIHRHFRDMGLLKEVHGRIDQPEGYWSIFLPEEYKAHPEKRYPLVFLMHGANNPIRLMQGMGVMELAGKEKFIVVTPQNEREEYVVDLYERVCRDYPVDKSRVYMMGFSFGAHTCGRMAMTHPELFAGVCPGSMPTLGDQKDMRITGIDYDAFTHTEAMVDHAAEVGLPCFAALGMSEMLKFFPFYDADMSYAEDTTENEDNVIRILFDDRALYDWYNAFRRMGGCAPVDPETAEKKSKASSSKAEQITGLLFESTEEWELSGRTYYVGNSTNPDGETWFKVCAVEDMLHMPTSHWAELCWDFLKQFSRDPETGKIVVESK